MDTVPAAEAAPASGVPDVNRNVTVLFIRIKSLTLVVLEMKRVLDETDRRVSQFVAKQNARSEFNRLGMVASSSISIVARLP